MSPEPDNVESNKILLQCFITPHCQPIQQVFSHFPHIRMTVGADTVGSSSGVFANGISHVLRGRGESRAQADPGKPLPPDPTKYEHHNKEVGDAMPLTYGAIITPDRERAAPDKAQSARTPLLGGPTGQPLDDEYAQKGLPEGTAGIMSSIVNLSNTILGTGMLAFPLVIVVATTVELT